MNKNLNKIIAIALAFGTVSAIAPSTSVNLLTTKAYAATDENDEEELESLELKTSSGSNIKLYEDDDYDDKVDSDDVEDGETYYAKTSSKTINIDIDGPSSKYVKVFKGKSSSTKGKSIVNDIDLSSGTTTLVIRVYSEKPDSDVRYDEDDDVTSEYTIKIKYTGSSSSSDEEYDADDYDDIYLEKLSVDGESISLSDSKILYTYNVANSVKEVTIKAVPEDEDEDTVTIDGDDVDEDDSWKKKVSLKEGENKIKIELENEDEDERVYTLKINRAKATSTSTNTNTGTSTNTTTVPPITTVKANQWVLVNGNWQYNDAMGTPVKNMWVKNYYLNAYGNMATGWLSNSGSWYYLGTDGAKKTGWQLASGSWYYLDGDGRMQTGWLRDLTTGKYYYLNSNGTMAYNTTVGGYKLGADGAWTK